MNMTMTKVLIGALGIYNSCLTVYSVNTGKKVAALEKKIETLEKELGYSDDEEAEAEDVADE